MPSDRIDSVFLTWNPRGPVTETHRGWLRAWLHKYATQWEFYVEIGGDGYDDDKEHLHGRLLLKKQMRMDKVKESLRLSMHCDTKDEKEVLYRGVKWLYDDCEYIRKDGKVDPALDYVTDESAWIYADPKNKREVRKNKRVTYHLALLKGQLPTTPCSSEDLSALAKLIDRKLGPFFARGEIELPTPSSLNNLLSQMARMHNEILRLPPEIVIPSPLSVSVCSDADYQDECDLYCDQCLMDSESD